MPTSEAQAGKNPSVDKKHVLRSGDMNRTYQAFMLSGFLIFVSYIGMSLVSEKSVKIKIDGKKFEYPEIRLILGYTLAFVGSTVLRVVLKEDISFSKILHPIYKNENYIISSVLLFFSKFTFLSTNNLSYIIICCFLNY